MRKSSVYLEYHDDTNNSHKFYLVEWGDSEALITYGRLGSKGVERKVEIHEAEQKIVEKLNKGYAHAEDKGWVGRLTSIDPFTKKKTEAKPKPKAKDLSIWDELAKIK